jgi:hypothetical protein
MQKPGRVERAVSSFRPLPSAFRLHPFVYGARSLWKSCCDPALPCPNLLPQESFIWVRHLRWVVMRDG